MSRGGESRLVVPGRERILGRKEAHVLLAVLSHAELVQVRNGEVFGFVRLLLAGKPRGQPTNCSRASQPMSKGLRTLIGG